MRVVPATATALALLVLTGCGASPSQAAVQKAIRDASPACASASFQKADATLMKAPQQLTCGAGSTAVTAYYFASSKDYDAQQAGLKQADVLAGYVVAGDQWLLTTDDQATAKALAKELEQKPKRKSDFLR